MEDRELYHFGIKGMKWGVWNEETKARRGAKSKKAEEQLLRNQKGGKDKPPTSNAERTVKDIKTTTDAITNTYDDVKNMSMRDKKAQAAKEAAERAKRMSDQEIREYLNRKNLERQYIDMETKDIDTGKDKVRDILTVVGDTVAIASGVVGIAAAIYTMTHQS